MQTTDLRRPDGHGVTHGTGSLLESLLGTRPSTLGPRYATLDTQRSMADSSNTYNTTRSWEYLENNLSNADLFRPELFIRPGSSYRGPPPTVVFCRVFPNYQEAQNKYRVFQEAGRSEDETFRSIQHLLQTTKEGVMTEKDKFFWERKARVHLKNLAGKKRRREKLSSMEGERIFKMTSNRAAGDEHTHSDPSFS